MAEYESKILNSWEKVGKIRVKRKTNEEFAADITGVCNEYAKQGWRLKSMSSVELPDQNYLDYYRVILVFERENITGLQQ